MVCLCVSTVQTRRVLQGKGYSDSAPNLGVELGKETMKINAFLYGTIFILILVATATGTFYRTSGAPIEYTTVRGEQAVYQGTGLYKYDPAWFALEGIVWDVINLFVGLPLFAVAIYLVQKNSLRGKLLLGGLLFYFVYVYLMFATGVAFNRLFLVYVAIFALSAVAFFLNLSGISVALLPARISARFPRGIFIVFTFVMSAVLVFLWLGRILPVMLTDQFPPDLAGVSTLESQALDLGMIVPLLFSTGILLWRHSAWGYLLTSVSLTHGFMMFISIPAWIVVPLIRNGKINLIEASPFLALSLIGIVLAGMFFANVQEKGR